MASMMLAPTGHTSLQRSPNGAQRHAKDEGMAGVIMQFKFSKELQGAPVIGPSIAPVRHIARTEFWNRSDAGAEGRASAHGIVLKYRKSRSATGAPFLRYSPYSTLKCSVSVWRHTTALNEHKLPREIPLARH